MLYFKKVKKEELLEQVNRALGACQKCRLFRTRTNVVPGEGNADAKIMFVGQCPGFHEDQKGRPFVGRAGQLLDQLLSEAGLKRGEVFITNIVKDRPPDNRDPMADEVRACEPYLDHQIKILNPKLIVTLGRFATEFFIANGKISQTHGVPHRVKGRLILPLYHPAAALRSTGVLEELRRDFKKIPEVLGDQIEVKEVLGTKVPENQMSLI